MLSRRQFTQGIARKPRHGNASPAIRIGRARARRAARRVIVDAQVHMWKANTPELPWVPGVKPQQPEPFTIERALPLMDEAGVDRVIIVPPTLTGLRNDYGIEAAKRYPDRFAVMGRFPVNDPKAAELLPRWKEQPGMLGVRITFGGTTWLKDGTVDWFWPAAEKARRAGCVPRARGAIALCRASPSGILRSR